MYTIGPRINNDLENDFIEINNSLEDDFVIKVMLNEKLTKLKIIKMKEWSKDLPQMYRRGTPKELPPQAFGGGTRLPLWGQVGGPKSHLLSLVEAA